MFYLLAFVMLKEYSFSKTHSPVGFCSVDFASVDFGFAQSTEIKRAEVFIVRL
jgi:hypothetical protein